MSLEYINSIFYHHPFHRSLPMRTGYFLPLMKKVTKEISAAEKLAKISLFHCCAWKLAPKKEVGSQTTMLTTFHKLIFIRYFSKAVYSP